MKDLSKICGGCLQEAHSPDKENGGFTAESLVPQHLMITGGLGPQSSGAFPAFHLPLHPTDHALARESRVALNSSGTLQMLRIFKATMFLRPKRATKSVITN
ncbi:hypothetical protein PoB_002645200 [Plakobranchus ocellatus]|uniref:Uncharacterized protein n=1 Tax=Plakobranchus ocellatus TaxID=259542 RepID=A0AAV3ZY00_9GAST|nr:hypothetical protein PoB_002645200 [Plakobranchus ocellatus]